jgi:hypothetical protein
MEGLTDVEHKRDLQQQQMHLQHKKADTEQLLALGRLHKEGQLTDIEFAQAKTKLLLSQVSMSDARSPMLTSSPTTRFQENSGGIATALDYYKPLNLEPQDLDSKDRLAPTDWIVLLRQELSGLIPEALRRRARFAGATAREIERAVDRAALIELIVVLFEEAREELSRLSFKELQQRAERLAVPRHEIERAEESTHARDRLVELVSRADQRGMHFDQAQHRQDEAASERAGALDQILVRLRPDPRDFRPKSAFDVTEPLANEGAPLLLPTAKTKEGATAVALTLSHMESCDEDDDAVAMHGDSIAALTKRLEEERQKAELRRQIAAAQSDGGAKLGAESESSSSSLQQQSLALPFRAQISAEPHPEPDPSPALVAAICATEPDLEPVAKPATTEEAAAKVQALWRGKAGAKKAAEQQHAVQTGSARIVAAKRTIRSMQMLVLLLVMLSTSVTTLLPNYVIGAILGGVANGEGIDGGISFSLGLRFGFFEMAAIFMQMEIFAYSMRDTPFVPGTAERILRPVLGQRLGLQCHSNEPKDYLTIGPHCFENALFWNYMVTARTMTE